MNRKPYTHLKKEERYVIEILYQQLYSVRHIASVLGRSPNTVSREIKQNMVAGTYTAKKASQKSSARRWRAKKQCLKVAMDRFLKQFVEEKLAEKWSPQQMSGYLRNEMNIICSAKAIYKYIEHRGLEYRLFWGWNKRKTGRKRGAAKAIHDNRKWINERPEISEPGHLEVDFVVSKHSTAVLLVATDRYTTYSWVQKLPNRKRTTVRGAFSVLSLVFSIKSITTDNDIAFRHWTELESIIQAPIYFCHPYHSWEKGLVENTNRWIRCFVPKRRDIASVTQEDVDAIHAFLNDRPRACLGYKIPSMIQGVS